MSEERIPKRSEVPEQFKWALEDIYATDEKLGRRSYRK